MLELFFLNFFPRSFGANHFCATFVSSNNGDVAQLVEHRTENP